ncbi:hypothetical protein AOXY_G8555 [Acipenser oxyrinchus oxyrinchus]|uniref:Ig-like domain-containing protein n=1 Tax=Acipenser oxyrinchus oxyrinchus TaxID=40147 RepID=A0AAD8DHD7_ACIOX|nr:hypothetical protein AOXY_G8555 [Acipenser oxyrinchus oxyrinchus]
MNGLLIIICLTCTFARHVSPGEKAVIECDLQGASEITWYRHRAGQSPVAIVLFAKGSSLPPTYYNDFHSRGFSTSTKSGTIILTIEHFTEADSATYYCASKEKGEVMFGNGTQLTNEGLQDDGNKTNERSSLGLSQIKSKNCDLFFILTISFSVILFLTFGGILLYCIKRKVSHNAKNSQCQVKEDKKDDSEEPSSYYADLDFSGNQKRKKIEKRNTTYAVIQFK